jgi:hypothetical protein
MTDYQLLISDNGSHSPEKWAIATAKQIFPVDDADFVGDLLLEARRKELELIELLAKHHGWHQKDEREKLLAKAEHIVSPLTADAQEITSKVVALMLSSSWGPHFSKPEVQEAVRDVIKTHTITNRYTERSWHADKNPHNHHARKFKEI